MSPEDWHRDEVYVIEFPECNSGLGIKVIGGISEDEEDDRDFGIFLKKVLNRGLASKDGRLCEGDQILEVNDYSLEQVTNAEAVSMLRQASAEGYIHMTVCRDQQSREEFTELLNAYSFSSNSSVYSCSSAASLKEGKWSWGPPDGEPSAEQQQKQIDGAPQPSSNTMPKISNAAAALHYRGPNMASTPARMMPNHPVIEQSLSLDPNVLINIEKLQVALHYLGLKPTDDQLKELRQTLDVHPDGTVTYGEFVKAARDLFKFQIETGTITPSPDLRFATPQDVLASLGPPKVLEDKSPIPVSEEFEAHQLRGEREVLKNQMERLKQMLRQKEQACRETESELHRVRKEAHNAVEQNRCLTTKLQLAEQANKQARSMELDYEEVIRSLEEQLAVSQPPQQQQQQQHLQPPQMPTKDGSKNLPKRIAVLGAQLKKAETAKKTYEVATEKLMSFTQGVSETLSTRGPDVLVKDSKNVVKTVKSLIDVQQNLNTDLLADD